MTRQSPFHAMRLYPLSALCLMAVALSGCNTVSRLAEVGSEPPLT